MCSSSASVSCRRQQGTTVCVCVCVFWHSVRHHLFLFWSLVGRRLRVLAGTSCERCWCTYRLSSLLTSSSALFQTTPEPTRGGVESLCQARANWDPGLMLNFCCFWRSPWGASWLLHTDSCKNHLYEWEIGSNVRKTSETNFDGCVDLLIMFSFFVHFVTWLIGVLWKDVTTLVQTQALCKGTKTSTEDYVV